MLGQCWGNVGAMLGQCWGNVGAMLGQCLNTFVISLVRNFQKDWFWAIPNTIKLPYF